MRIEINEYIVTDSEICHGQLTFKGTRIMVWQVTDLLAAGVSINEIIRDYFPHITKKAILAALTYVSEIVGGERYVAFQQNQTSL